MPDDLHSRSPRTWTDAFAALPVESAPAGGWSRLQAALDADEPRAAVHPSIYGVRRQRIAFAALAASLALGAMVPWPLEPQRDPSVPQVARSEAHPLPSKVHGLPMRDADSAHGQPARTASIASTADVVAAAVPAAEAGQATRRAPHATRWMPDVASMTKAGAQRAAPEAGGSETMPVEAPAPDVAVAASAAIEPADAALTRLYTESAQLEALLALTRDDRVQSATTAVLANELDARIGLIDAALAEPGLSAVRRTVLWQQRLATLREITDMESSERWLAANGTAAGDAFVRID